MRSGRGSIFTPMNLFQYIRMRAYERARLRRDWRPIKMLSDEAGIPDGWVECSHCGAWGWRWPPHGMDEACPLVAGVYEAMAAKTDAERMMAVRGGIQMDSMREIMEEHFRSPGDEL